MEVTNVLNPFSSLFKPSHLILKKAQSSIDTEPEQADIKYTVRCLMEDLESFDKWAEALNCGQKRKSIIEKGAKQADLFLAYVNTMSKK